ncbi:MAG: DUF4129 domain-containing protein, partial [Thermococcus sp.]
VALLAITVVLMALLMNGHSFSVPTKGMSREEFDQLLNYTTLIMSIGVLAGLIMIIVLVIYFRDIPGAKRCFEKEGAPFQHVLAALIFGLVLSVIFRVFFSGTGIVARNSTNATNATCVPANGTVNLTNCTVPNVGPLSTAGGNQTVQVVSKPLVSHLWMVFLIPVIFAFAYLGYYYYRLGREEVRRKKKIEKAIEFDRALDELGLERFSNPKEAIVEIYKNAVLWLEGLGVPYRESWTHWEHAEHVKYMHDAFVELTKLFEKAKYAPERLSWSDAERALEVYNRLRGKARELAEAD